MTSNTPPRWTNLDCALAAKEGWNIFNIDTFPEIQRDDEAAIFSSDNEAIAFVKASSSPHCNKALLICSVSLALLPTLDGEAHLEVVSAESPEPEPYGQPVDWRITILRQPTDRVPVYFDCDADDQADAESQAKEAFPSCVIL